MNMCQAFADAGHDVTLYARPGDPVENEFDFYGVAPNFGIVKTAARGSRRLREWTYAALTTRNVRCRRFDLIYGRSLPTLATAALGDLPFIYEAHQPASLMGRAVERVLFRRPNLVRCVFISKSLQSAYLKNYAQLRNVETLVAHDGTNVPLTESQRTHDVPDSARLRVGYSGSFYAGRGIEILCALAQRLPNLDFHICGGSSEEVTRCRNQTGGCQNITFHGFLPPSHTRAWQSSMDVLLAPYQLSVPTVRWMSPLKIFEYMASGKAIIASDVPVLREVLCSGSNAMLVPPDDVSAWSKALLQLCDASVRKSLGQQALADLRTTYTWTSRAEMVLQGARNLAVTQ